MDKTGKMVFRIEALYLYSIKYLTSGTTALRQVTSVILYD